MVDRQTLTDFAKSEGMSKQAANKAKKQGRVTVGHDGKVDPEQARKELAGNSTPKTEKKSTTTFAEARTNSERWKAKLNRLEFETKSGKLIDRAKAVKEVKEMIAASRSRLLSMADKLAPQLATDGAGSPGVCKQLVAAEVQEALSELSQYDG